MADPNAGRRGLNAHASSATASLIWRATTLGSLPVGLQRAVDASLADAGGLSSSAY